MKEKQPIPKGAELAYGEFSDTKSTIDANKTLIEKPKIEEKPTETDKRNDIIKP